MTDGTATRRYRRVPARAGQLTARYGRSDDGTMGVVYAHGGGGTERSDMRILCNALEEVAVHRDRTFVQELESRGYDVTTLRFSIEKRRSDGTA